MRFRVGMSDRGGCFTGATFILAATLLIILASISMAEDTPLVQIKLVCQDLNGTPIQTVKVEDEFRIAISVQDLRPAGTYVPLDGQYAGQMRTLQRGVYATYFKLYFDQNITSEAYPLDTRPSSVVYMNGYNQMTRKVITDNYILLGSGRTTGNGPGTREIILCYVYLQANMPGIQTFAIKVDNMLSPMEDTLLYQNQISMTAPPPDPRARSWQIVTKPASVTVVPK